jgi:hypothetical protein
MLAQAAAVELLPTKKHLLLLVLHLSLDDDEEEVARAHGQ